MTTIKKLSKDNQFLSIQENLELQVRNVLEWVPRYQSAPRNLVDKNSSYLPNITCASDQLNFNAYVSVALAPRPHYHFSVAVPLALSYVALALTATEEFMPEVPIDSSLTMREDPKETGLHNFVNYNHLRLLESGVPTPRRTDDSRRYPIGDSLFALALQFIALHEEGHYLNGHLDPSLSFCQQGTYRETNNISLVNSADDSLTLRALELDADHFALITMLIPLLMEGGTRYISATASELGRTPLGFLHFVGNVSTMLGAILWQAESGMSEIPIEKRTHPSPFCRIVHFAHLSSRFVSLIAKSDSKAQAWNEAINRDTAAILDLFGFKGVTDFRLEADTPWKREYNETRQRLIEIKPKMSDAAAHARNAIGVIEQFPGDFIELLKI